MPRRILGLLVVATVLAASPAALAKKKDREPIDTSDYVWDKRHFQLGGFFTTLNTGFRIGTDNLGLGILLNAEKFLGLDETDTAFRLDAGWRFSKNYRHKIDFSWFQLNRDGSRVIDEEIELPDRPPIPAGSTVESVFNFDIFKIRYNYSFLIDERIDLFVGGGLYVMPIEYGLGEIGQNATVESITAPLPVVALGFRIAMTPRWFFRQQIDFLYLELQGFKGEILDLNFSLEYRVHKYVGLGLGVETLDIAINSEADSNYPGAGFVGAVGFKYTGMQFYVRGRF